MAAFSITSPLRRLRELEIRRRLLHLKAAWLGHESEHGQGSETLEALSTSLNFPIDEFSYDSESGTIRFTGQREPSIRHKKLTISVNPPKC